MIKLKFTKEDKETQGSFTLQLYLCEELKETGEVKKKSHLLTDVHPNSSNRQKGHSGRTD